MSDTPDRTLTIVSDLPQARSREAVPILAGTLPAEDEELKRLLARRLRQAFAIFTIVYAAFLLRQLPLHFGLHAYNRELTILLAVGFVVQGFIAAIVHIFRNATGRWLQTVEWISLFTFWITQGLNQLFAILQPEEMNVLFGNGEVGPILTANTWLLPWFAVAAGYPVLVPNSLLRTSVIVGVTAAIPILVTVLASILDSRLTLAYSWPMYLQFFLWGSIGVSIAVYGARQAALLRKEAFEAKKYGQYRLIRRLDGGGMGDVYLAEHRLLRRPSVIKLIRPDHRANSKMLRRFEREVKMLATLTHWNTVEVYDYGHTPDGTFYFVMEYLPGINLNNLVSKHGPLPPERAVFLLLQVCQSLQEAHRIGLIHRDIKPANIMACERGGLHDVAKLLDFGLVQAPDDPVVDDKLTREGAIMGTPAFLSPEQACGKSVDARSDIYSLGCTAFFLLFGRPPFQKSSAMATVAAHIHELPVIPPEVPAEIAAVIDICLKKSPDSRYGSIRELEAALANCIGSESWNHERAQEWWLRHEPSTG